MAGNKLGLAIFWAAFIGAFLKYVLSEGLTRWQLATGSTLLEGCVDKFGTTAQVIFLLYLLIWTPLTASSVMSSCGVAAYAIWEPIDPGGWLDPNSGRIVFGILHSISAVILVRAGGYRLFEWMMSACIVVMFITVVVTAIAVRPSWGDVAAGLVTPTIPDLAGQGLGWTIAFWAESAER